ncbi:MAG: non-ribosomal peptide synthetase, partial [Oxalobacteraceae bacterium]
VTRGYVAPQGAIETAIAAIWQDLLGLDRVGRDDHFFELGGHSLMAVQVVSRIEQTLQLELSLRTLFNHPTLADFARTAARAGRRVVEAIGSADRSRALPLSYEQQRLWVLDRLDHAAGGAYHIRAALRLKGSLNEAALQAALDGLVARHEILRTTFADIDGTPVQRIAANGTIALQRQDLRHLSGHEQECAVVRIGTDEGSERFDLAAGPLVRARLLRLAEDEHVLLVTQHHIVSDGWSTGILVREVSQLYAAFSQGRAAALPPLAIQYADYAAWQRAWLQGELLRDQARFWKDHLAGAPALLELPADHPRPAVQGHAGSHLQFTLPAGLVAQLRALSQRHGTTLFMTLLAGWGTLLARLSGQDDIVIGTPVANRGRTELEGLIGFFVNTLALRVRPEGDLSVAQLLAEVKADTLGAYEHQDLPFDQVVEALQPVRSMSHSPVFQVMFSMNNTPGGTILELPGLAISAVDQPSTTTQYDLVLSLTEAGDAIDASISYATDLFERASVERIVANLQVLLAGMAADDGQALCRLPLLSQSEQVQLATFNATAAPFPHDQLIQHVFEAQARARPDAIALAGEEDLSYGTLNARANRLAHHLLALGVKADDRVALCMQRSTDMVVALLAILKAGAGYVPLDPAYPAERLAFMLDDCAPAALLTCAALADRLPQCGAPCVLVDADAAAIAGHPDDNPDVEGLHPASLAYVIYTSGSTGRPNGVQVVHRNVLRLAVNGGFAPLAPDDCVA